MTEQPSDDEAEYAPTTDGDWIVWRQDDNGNRYIVSRHRTRSLAQEVADRFDALGHKQLYWVSRHQH